MNRVMYSIVLPTLLAQSVMAEIVNATMTPQHFDRLYRAAVDISMRCYGDPGNGIGIIGDRDGSILKELRSKRLIPVALINDSRNHGWDSVRSFKLQVFIIAVNSPTHLYNALSELENYIWSNEKANFLIVDSRPELTMQCTNSEDYMAFATQFGILNALFICYNGSRHSEPIMIWNSNPFVHRAPDVWTFRKEYDLGMDEYKLVGYLFTRSYGKTGESCESMNFKKTGDIGGYPLDFVSHMPLDYLDPDSEAYNQYLQLLEQSSRILFKWLIDDYLWFIDNIALGMNASAYIVDEVTGLLPATYGISLQPHPFSTRPEDLGHSMILRLNQMPILAISQHTPHMSQLNKILSVIDGESRIGMWIVYLITFLFFKFFMGQSVIAALLNLVRLTCGYGLTTLPQKVAPTIYLASLFMFVVTLQAIYTGNLATLLTTIISYPNVQTREHIPKLGYKIYNREGHHITLIADPILDGCVVEIEDTEDCIDYLLRDPLGVCVMNHALAIFHASVNNLHLSRESFLNEYMIHETINLNLLQGRVEDVLTILFEAGLYHWDPALENLRLEFVDDDDVKKNLERRVMNLEDLGFAFVVLGVGLLFSIGCFTGEIFIFRMGLKHAKQRNRVRFLPARAEETKKIAWFRSLNCRFDSRNLFANRR